MKRLIYWIMIFYYKIEYCITRLIPCKEENTVLLVRTDNIGDFILWSDSAKEYKKHYYNNKITLICNSSCYDIAKNLLYFDEVIKVSPNKFLRQFIYRLKFLIKLSKRKFQIIISPTYSKDFFVTDTMIHCLKSDEKVGFRGDYTNIKTNLRIFGFSDNKKEKIKRHLNKQSLHFYTMLVEPTNGNVMELNRNAEFIRGFLNKDFLSSIPNPPLNLPTIDNLPKDYVVIFIGASSMNKLWQEEKYAEVINSLNENIVICGGKGDIVVWDKIKEYVYNDKHVINLVGKTNILELFAVIKDAKYLVTNDTSASHIAPMVHTPSVVLLPGVFYGRFHPYAPEMMIDNIYIPNVVNYPMDCYQCHNICDKVKDKIHTWPCIANIQVEQVLNKIEEIRKQIS